MPKKHQWKLNMVMDSSGNEAFKKMLRELIRQEMWVIMSTPLEQAERNALEASARPFLRKVLGEEARSIISSLNIEPLNMFVNSALPAIVTPILERIIQAGLHGIIKGKEEVNATENNNS